MKNHLFGRSIALTLLVCVPLTLLLASCGKHNANPQSQLAAKVGPYEITQYQVDTAASTLPNLDKADFAAAKAGIVKHLVERQLLVQRAQALKVDRTPQVLAAIDASRQDILAKAYASQIVGVLPQPSDEEIKKYYDDHPELFSGRKLYSLKEIRVQSESAGDASAAIAAGTTAKSIEDLAQTLRDKGIKFTFGSVTRAPESLPLKMLPSFSQAKDGAVLAFPVGDGAYVAQIVNTKLASVDLRGAAPSIRRFLMAQRENVAMSEELARLRTTEKIEYFGEYAKLINDSDSSKEPSPTDAVAPDVPQTGTEQKP